MRLHVEDYSVEQWSRVDAVVGWVEPDFLDDALVPDEGAVHVPELASSEPGIWRVVIDLLLSVLQS